MKTFLCLLVMAMGIKAIAQNKPCPGKPEEVKGAWSLETKGSITYNPDIIRSAKPHQVKMLALRDSVLRLIRLVCPELRGFKASQLTVHVTPSVVDSGIAAYDQYTHYNPYICTYKGTLEPVESLTNFRVGINTLDQENFIRHQFVFDAIGEDLYSIPPSAGTIQGYSAYRISNISSAERFGVVIPRSGALPYEPLTKAEFYTILKKLIRANQSHIGSDITKNARIRPEAVLRAELKAEMEEIDKSNLGQDAKNSRKRRLQEDFRTDEQMLQERLAAVDQQYDGYYYKVEELEKRFKSELNRPMYVKEYEFSLSALGNENAYFNDPTAGYCIIRMNPGYFMKKADIWQPQFMLLTWRVEPDRQYSVSLDAAWRERLDMKALEKMLVK
jgi:hypothetical protein